MPRLVYICLGWTCVGLGIIGAFLPLMPTTVFMILAAFLFGKGSPRARAWLTGHRVFGPSILRWEQDGAIPRRAKIWATVAMAAAFVLALVLHLPAWALILEAIALISAAAFVLSRPD